MNTVETGKSMPYYCPACEAIPQAGYCRLAGCPTAPKPSDSPLRGGEGSSSQSRPVLPSNGQTEAEPSAEVSRQLLEEAVRGVLFELIKPECGDEWFAIDKATDAVLDAVGAHAPVDADLLDALLLAEDVPSRSPFSTRLWVTSQYPEGLHPSTGIEQIRAAIAKALGAPTASPADLLRALASIRDTLVLTRRGVDELQDRRIALENLDYALEVAGAAIAKALSVPAASPSDAHDKGPGKPNEKAPQ